MTGSGATLSPIERQYEKDSAASARRVRKAQLALAGLDLPALWREHQAAVAEQIGSGLCWPDSPACEREMAAAGLIRDARPTDLAGLAVQLRLFQNVLDGSDPNADDEAMLAHVADQIEALAERAAA